MTIPAVLQTALAGRYEIECEVGQGGMAIVYLARDVRHDRSVALKIMRPDLVTLGVGTERFLREIRLTANLQHPHILSLFDSGEAAGRPFYVMPYVDGESLRQRLERETSLPVEEAVRLAGEVADALAYAHTRGIVHRDIKPENLLLSGGHVLVADFGIARAVDLAGITDTGMAIGTPQYMSPEQATGSAKIDGATDQYALGCVLYEMLAGAPPFSGATAQAVLARQATDDVPSLRIVRPGVPPGIETALLRALAKVPADRWPDTTAFANELRAPSPRVRTPRIRAALAVAALVVAAAGWLGAHVVRGNRRAPDVPASAHTRNADAWSLYEQGQRLFMSHSAAAVMQATSLYRQALEHDSTFSEAWAALGRANVFRAQVLSGAWSADLAAETRLAANHAIRYDSASGDGYWVRGTVRLLYDWDFEGMEDYRRGVALSPRSPDAQLYYAAGLNVVNEPDSALAHARLAHALDPSLTFYLANLGVRFAYLGWRDSAIAYYVRALQANPGEWVASLALLGVAPPAMAQRELDRLAVLSGDTVPMIMAYMADYLGRAGRVPEARAILRRLERLRTERYVQSTYLARARLAVGDRGGALDALEESARNHDQDLMWDLSSFLALRGNPRFDALAARVYHGRALPSSFWFPRARRS